MGAGVPAIEQAVEVGAAGSEAGAQDDPLPEQAGAVSAAVVRGEGTYALDTGAAADAELGACIAVEVTDFVRRYQTAWTRETAWGEPLVSFADARDPLFGRLKGAVSPTHLMPGDVLEGAETVVTYFVPFAREIVRSNRRGRHASREWAVAYVETNVLIVAMNAHLAAFLEQRGFGAVVLPPTHNFDEERLVSDWSHKHVAYIAGLGSFGLHHMLITGRGCCGRLGSLVTSATVEATPRRDIERCLYHYDGSCSACVKRCVGGALSEERLDRHACYAVCLENAELHAAEVLADVCGKCASMVACSFEDPVAKARRRGRDDG